MKLKTLVELKRVAEVRPPLARDRMSKRQRLARWAEVLELAPQRYLRSLFETEYMWPRRRYALREDCSPLTVAFEDPVLRTDGLESDRYGDALKFFELSNGVRRQSFLDRRAPDLREVLAHLVGHSMQRICGVASADVRWSVV